MHLDGAVGLKAHRAGRNPPAHARRRVVHVGPGERVDGVVGAVREATDAVNVVVDQRATQTVEGVSAFRVAAVRVIGEQRAQEGKGEEVAPSLPHPGAREPVEPRRVADEPVGDAVGQLVEDDGGVEAPVAHGGGAAPQVHAHDSRRPVGSHVEIGVVGASG